MHVWRTLLAVAALVVVSAIPAMAQETGSISGYVFDQNGAPVEGVPVKVSGEKLPAGRTVTTSAVGQYSFPLLLPGSYTVEAQKDGVGTSTRSVVVLVSRDSQLDIVLGLTVQEAIEVSAVPPTVDLKSTEVNFNYAAETIAALPLARSYAGLFQLIPGVADNASFAPNGGASRQDNAYLLDGVNITNPGFGYLATEVNEFDIAEFNVKRGAITAEFGRAQGFVTNAVTRSGTNQLRGGVRFEMIPDAFISDGKDTTLTSKTDRYVPSFGIGGPIVRDKAFFYASGRFYRSTVSDRVNRLGEVPDRKERTNELFGKVNFQPTAAHSIVGSYRHRPTEVDFDSIGVNDSADMGTNYESTNRVATLNWSWFIGGRTYFDIKYLRLDEENESVAITELADRGATINPNNLGQMGQFTDPVLGRTVGGNYLKLNRQNYKRDEVRATLSQMFDIGGTSHQFKAGFSFEDSYEDLTRIANGWGIVSLINSNTQVNAVYYPDQPAQLGKARTYGIFVQDDITIGQRLTVNAGLLFNRDDFIQDVGQETTFLKFGFGKQIQPRIGFNYQLRKGVGDKIYGNYGRYYAMDQKSSARSLAPNRLFTNTAVFDAVTGAKIRESQTANTTGKVLLDMDPTYMDEFLIGYATPLIGPYSLDVFFLYRNSEDFIEDYPSILPNSAYVVSNIPEAERKYRTLTFELNRRMQNRWSMNISYAYSRLWGNFDLDYASGAVFNTSSLIEDGPGAFVEDTLRYGELSQDRPHVFKMFATVNPIDNVTLSGYLRTQSGAAWEARGLPWGSTLTYLRYLEQAGSRRIESWTNFDFLASYRLPLNGRFNVLLEGRFINLFNNQATITVDKRLYLDGRIRAFTSEPGPNCDRACYTDLMVQGTTTPNPDFGEATSYASPRAFLATVRVDF